MQLREMIVIRRFQERKTVAEIARLAGYSERKIYKIPKLHRDFGHTRNLFARCRGRPRTLNQTSLLFHLFLMPIHLSFSMKFKSTSSAN